MSTRAEPLPARLTSIHPWLSAYILSLAHPYFAVTGPDGRFEIKNVPPGDWEFAMWHERAGLLPTNRFPTGRFTWKVRYGENALGELRVDPKTLEAAEAAPPEPPAERDVPPVDRLDEQGFSQVHRAASGGHVQRLRELLEAGADVNVEQGTYHGRPLQYAASFGHGEVVQVLIDHGAKIDSEDANRRTPLIWAAMNGYADVIRRLLDGRGGYPGGERGWPAPNSCTRGYEGTDWVKPLCCWSGEVA